MRLKKLSILLLPLLLFAATGITVFAGEATITTTVPDSHGITVNADGADVLYDGMPGSHFTADRLSNPTLLIRPESGKEIAQIQLNGEDITDLVKGGYYTLDPLCEDQILTVTTRDAGTVQGKTYTVQGTVSRSGQPVQGITLELRSTLKTTVTDQDGTFSFHDVECGKHSLTAIENGKAVGYAEFVLTEGRKVDMSFSDAVYTVTTDQNTVGINLKMNLKDDGTMQISKATAVQDNNNQSPASPSDTANTSGTASPPTGDDTDVMLWTMLMLLSMAGMAAARGLKRS